MKPVEGFWSSYMVHSTKTGVLKNISISKRLETKIVEQEIWANPGDEVHAYLGSNHTLGTMILRYESMSEMLEMLDNMENDIWIDVY
jgi:antitoxin component of MazEF toxin-antitoxin module